MGEGLSGLSRSGSFIEGSLMEGRCGTFENFWCLSHRGKRFGICGEEERSET
jgi:hypothetical protein